MTNPNNPNQTPQDQTKKPGMGKPMDQQGQKAQPKTGQDGDMDKNKPTDINKDKRPDQGTPRH